MGVFAAFGMAARRWYILLPMVALSAGAAWLAYTQMPASYDATAVYRVTGGADSSVQARAGSPQVNPAEVAGRLIGKMQPGAGRPAGPYTVSGRPGSPIITIKASGEGASQALDRIGAANTRLNAALNTLETERVVPPNAGLRLDATMPPTTGPPIRDTGIQVFVVTLLFGLMLSLVFAAAVERSSRRRRALSEPTVPPAPSEDDKPTDVVARVKDEPPAARAVSDADRVAAKTERHALDADRRPPDTDRHRPDASREVAAAEHDAPDAGQRAPGAERRAPDAGRTAAPEVERAPEPVASTATHALEPTRARSGAHALREEPDEHEPDAGASLATSAIPMGSVRSEDAGASLATSAIPMGSMASDEGPDESLATSAIPMGSVMSNESADEALATSAIPMGSVRPEDEGAGTSLATSAIPMGSATSNEDPDESSNESADESLATTAIPMGSVTSTSADESLATTAIPMGTVTSTSTDESLVTTAIPLPPADRLVPPPGSFPAGPDQSPAAAAMRTAMNTPSRPVGESMGRPGPPDRPRDSRPISPVRGPGPLPPEPPRRPAHALVEPPEPSAPREMPGRIDLSGATELSDLSELRLPTPPAPLGPRPPDPSIGLLGSRPPSGDQFGRPVPPANQEPPRSGPPLSLVPNGAAPGPQGPPESFADREDAPEQPRTPPRLRAVPPLDERPDRQPAGPGSGQRWEPSTPSVGNADGWLPANLPSNFSSEQNERYEPAEPVSYEPHERPETRHVPEPVEYDDIPAGFELDDAEDERPPAQWDDLAAAGDPVEEPIDEEPADHRWDNELSGRDDDADAEDQFGWPEFADEDTADEDEVRDEAPAAPPVDDDDEEEDAVESWERWGDENERPSSSGDENERRVSRGAATG